MVGVFAWSLNIEEIKENLIIGEEFCYEKRTVGGDLAQWSIPQMGYVLGLWVKKAKAKRFFQVESRKVLPLFYKAHNTIIASPSWNAINKQSFTDAISLWFTAIYS